LTVAVTLYNHFEAFLQQNSIHLWNSS
jgi:hypothetical protein